MLIIYGIINVNNYGIINVIQYSQLYIKSTTN